MDWTNVRGAVMVGRSLFYGLMTGTNTGCLYKRSFDGTSFGDPVLLNPYRDPLWNTVLTGSGPATQTYTGVLPTWYTSTTAGITQTTGMFYWKGRLYYTKTGNTNLFWRWFVPDSGIVGPVENTLSAAAAPGFTWNNAKGMFLDGSNLYVVNATDGSLNRLSFVNGTTSRHVHRGEQQGHRRYRLARPGALLELGASERLADRRLHLHVRRPRLRVHQHLDRLRRLDRLVRLGLRRR